MRMRSKNFLSKIFSTRSLRSSRRFARCDPRIACAHLYPTHALRAISKIVLRTRLKNLSNPCGTLEVSLRDSQESCRCASTLIALDLIVTKMTNTHHCVLHFLIDRFSIDKIFNFGTLFFDPKEGPFFGL